MNYVNRIIDEENAEKSAHTRRQMISGAGAVIGGMGLAGPASGARSRSALSQCATCDSRRGIGRGLGSASWEQHGQRCPPLGGAAPSAKQ